MARDTTQSAGARRGAANRLGFIDHLRAGLTVLVVAHHAAQAYGPTGGAWPVSEAERSPVLGLMIAINAMFFMGLFFFVAGYFTPATVERKGAAAFVRDRLVRLGIPAVLVWGLTAGLMDRPQFLHLWFVVDLLALNLLYVAFVRGRQAPPVVVAEPTVWPVAGLVLVLAVGAALVRIVYPIDRWIDFLGILPVEPAHWVQYGSLYALGVWAGRRGWIERIPDRLGGGALSVAALSIAAFAAYRFWPGRTADWFATSGWRWGNFNFALLESVICVTLGVGLLWLFRRVANREVAAMKAFAADAYGIYCVHLPVVVALHLALKPLALGPLVKFTLSTVAGVLISWAVTRALLRSTALGRRIF